MSYACSNTSLVPASWLPAFSSYDGKRFFSEYIIDFCASGNVHTPTGKPVIEATGYGLHLIAPDA